MKPQVNKDHYNFERYVNKPRWMSYYNQLRLIYALNPQSVLEIGVGNNFLKKQLSDQFSYKTLDIAKDLKPDFLGSADNIPIKDNSFDLVCAFQVLEHLPFNKFETCLQEMARVSKKHVLISLPYCNISPNFKLKVPLFPEIKFSMTIPRFFQKYKFNGEHYWEIGTKGYPLKRIKGALGRHFRIKRVINPYDNKYHIFFVLEKI